MLCGVGTASFGVRPTDRGSGYVTDAASQVGNARRSAPLVLLRRSRKAISVATTRLLLATHRPGELAELAELRRLVRQLLLRGNTYPSTNPFARSRKSRTAGTLACGFSCRER